MNGLTFAQGSHLFKFTAVLQIMSLCETVLAKLTPRKGHSLKEFVAFRRIEWQKSKCNRKHVKIKMN